MKNEQAKKTKKKVKHPGGEIVRLHGTKQETAEQKKTDQILVAVEGRSPKSVRKTGIDILGDVGWGTHFCLFYQTKEDLIDILVPYFKAGLENNEFCMWVTSEPLNAEDARRSLNRAVKNLDGYIKKGQIEILDYSDWYTKKGVFEPDKVLQGWVDKHNEAVKRGYDGLRVTGNTLWLEKKDWKKFVDYEAVVNSVIGKYQMLAVCTYSLDKCGASEILDVEHNHQFALIKWKGDWKILESSGRNQFEARLAEQTMIAQALEHSKKEWVNTFNAISDWVVLVDLKGQILRTNRIGEKFTGAPLDEIVGQSCCKLVHGSEKHIPGCPLKKMLDTRQQETTELQVPGTSRWLMVTVDPVTDQEGNLTGAVHITRDITERKKAEQALRESEKRYKYLFEQSPVGIELTTPDGKVVCANKTMEVLTGYFEAELKKLNLADTYENPQDRKRLLETIDRYGCAVDFPVRLKRKDGTVYDALLNVSRVHLDGNDLFQTICTDITERKEAEEALRSERNRLISVFEAMADGVYIVNQQHDIQYVNPALIKDFGNWQERKCYEYFHDRKEVCPWCKNEQVWAGKTVRWEWYSFKNDRTYDLIDTPLQNPDGSVSKLEIFRDITERKQAEEEIVKLAKFPSENPNPVLRISRDGTVLYANSAGSAPLETWGIQVGQRLPEACYKRVREALSSGKVSKFEFVCHDGRIFEVTLAPVVESGYVNAYGLEITERKKAEEALRESEKVVARGQLASEIAHELNNPLAGIKNSFLLIKGAIGRDHPYHRYLGLIDKEIGRISSIVRQMFDLSRPSEIEAAEFSIDDTIREVVTLLGVNCRKHNVVIGISGKSAVATLPEVSLRQVLYNLVKNAIEASPPGGEIEITQAITEGVLTIRVCDEGDGIPQEAQPHIFEPAFTTKEDLATAGLGLGLSISKNIVEEMGGSLYFESKTGQGTVFSIVIPLGKAGKGVKNG